IGGDDLQCGRRHLVRARCLGRLAGADQLPAMMLLRIVLFSGPVVMIGLTPNIHHEVILWVWGLAVWFLALLVPVFDRGLSPSGFRLSALAALAGCALMTRPSTGLGLILALGLLLLHRAWHEGSGNPLSRLLRFACQGRIIVPVLILGGFLAIAAGVNQARWGDPFTFADLRLQSELLAQHPDRLARLETYGLFNIRRLGLGLIYYFFPIWALTRDGVFVFHDDIDRLFDAFELPPSSILLTDPLTVLLAAMGLAALVRRTVPGIARGQVLAVMAGLAVPPALMLIAWYMAFRYRVEFMPILLLAAGIGAMRLGQRMTEMSERARRRTVVALMTVLFVQVAAAHAFAILYRASPGGPSLHHAAGGIAAYYLGVAASR
ncbi:MAG TPA: hypothetical protein VN329_05655, partial [Roseomonas sp.]|nr:hypothetical protein [Roseomonas sp.]